MQELNLFLHRMLFPPQVKTNRIYQLTALCLTLTQQPGLAFQTVVGWGRLDHFPPIPVSKSFCTSICSTSIELGGNVMHFHRFTVIVARLNVGFNCSLNTVTETHFEDFPN